MSDQSEPASSRIPLEIWWKVFEDMFSTEDLFATTYDGDDWGKDAKNLQCTDTKAFQNSEEQRKILRSVCKSWRHLSDTVGSRFVPLAMYYEDDKWSLPDIEAITNTWRLYLGNSTPLPQGLDGVTVQWRLLRIGQTNTKNLEQILRPHLRRLDFYLGGSDSYVPDDFIGALKPFANITWLRYLTNSKSHGGHCLKDDDGEKLTLPHLQVLYYYGYDGLHLPFYRLDLPCIRHLAITAVIPSDQLPLRSLIAAYGESLYSLHIHVAPSDSGHPAPDELFPDDDPSYFPHWNHVPYLRDLSLGEHILLNYHPLPLDHPLRAFTAQICKISNFCSWITIAENLKIVRMLRAARDDEGGLIRASNSESILDREGLEELEAKAASKGIVLELFREPQDTDLGNGSANA